MSKPIVLLPLSQGKFAMIDSDDFEKVGRVKWSAKKTKSGNFYAVHKPAKSKALFLHCEILGSVGVDHIDGDGLNCRRENLRPATTKQNKQAFCRKAPGSTSKFRGVSWYRGVSKWVARVRFNNRLFYLGKFSIEEDAAKAYDKKARELGFFDEALNFKS